MPRPSESAARVDADFLWDAVDPYAGTESLLEGPLPHPPVVPRYPDTQEPAVLRAIASLFEVRCSDYTELRNAVDACVRVAAKKPVPTSSSILWVRAYHSTWCTQSYQWGVAASARAEDAEAVRRIDAVIERLKRCSVRPDARWETQRTLAERRVWDMRFQWVVWNSLRYAHLPASEATHLFVRELPDYAKVDQEADIYHPTRYCRVMAQALKDIHASCSLVGRILQAHLDWHLCQHLPVHTRAIADYLLGAGGTPPSTELWDIVSEVLRKCPDSSPVYAAARVLTLRSELAEQEHRRGVVWRAIRMTRTAYRDAASAVKSGEALDPTRLEYLYDAGLRSSIATTPAQYSPARAHEELLGAIESPSRYRATARVKTKRALYSFCEALDWWLAEWVHPEPIHTFSHDLTEAIQQFHLNDEKALADAAVGKMSRETKWFAESLKKGS